MSFRLRAKPKKPTKKKKELNSFHIYDGTTLSELIRALPDGVDPKDAIIEAEWRYDESEMYLNWYEEESTKEFDTRMKQYNVKNKAYQAWYEEFKAEILEEKQRKKDVANAKARSWLEKEQTRLNKQLAALNKHLKTKA